MNKNRMSINRNSLDRYSITKEPMQSGIFPTPFNALAQPSTIRIPLHEHLKPLRRIALAAICLITSLTVFSQAATLPFQQNKNIPSFEIQQVNNSTFTNAKLKKNVPLIIMFFSPGCDHCIHQFEDMVKRMNDLKKYQIVMTTYQPIEELAEFNKKYNIAKYPNIITGRDVNYFFPTFFGIRNFPYLAFYDKQGKLISTFEGNMSVDNMLKKFR